jgi:hypothetical protein
MPPSGNRAAAKCVRALRRSACSVHTPLTGSTSCTDKLAVLAWFLPPSRSTYPEVLWVSSTAMAAAPDIVPHGSVWRKLHERPCPLGNHLHSGGGDVKTLGYPNVWDKAAQDDPRAPHRSARVGEVCAQKRRHCFPPHRRQIEPPYLAHTPPATRCTSG